MRKIGIPLQPQFFYIKVGFKGVFIARTCFPDVTFWVNFLSTRSPKHMKNSKIGEV